MIRFPSRRLCRVPFVVAVLLLAGSAGPAAAQTCDVSFLPYPTLQSALDDPACSVVRFGFTAAPFWQESVVVPSGRVVRVEGGWPMAAAAQALQADSGRSTITVERGAELTLRNMLVVGIMNMPGGAGAPRGGVVHNRGTLVVEDSYLNAGVAGAGGILYNEGGVVRVFRSSLFGARAFGNGGVLVNAGGQVTATDSTIAGGISEERGGGIYQWGEEASTELIRTGLRRNRAYRGGGGAFIQHGTFTARSATIWANVAAYNEKDQDSLLPDGRGGGIHVRWKAEKSATPTIVLNNVTFFENEAAYGGGIYNARTEPANVLLTNTAVGENRPSDCGGAPVDSGGFNLDSDKSCDLGALRDRSGTPPMVHIESLPLPWKDVAVPDPGSPLIDRGNPGTCENLDERGFFRFICDKGANEAATEIRPKEKPDW